MSSKTDRSGRKSTKGTKEVPRAGSKQSKQVTNVVVTNDGSMERYDPEAFREAALRSMEARQASSFSPMQVRDMSMPPQQQALRQSALALQDSTGPQDGMPTGFG